MDCLLSKFFCILNTLNNYFKLINILTTLKQAKDPVVEKLFQSTEEGQKVTRNKGVKLVAVFRRIQDPYQV